MGLITQPNIIEQSSFTGGYSPDGTDAVKDSTALIDGLNLILDPTHVTTITPVGTVRETSSGSLITRKGFKRLSEELIGSGTHFIRDIHQFRHESSGATYLIAILSTGTSAANNVQVWAYNLSSLTGTRIDAAGRTWTNYNDSHWGFGVDNIYYGGTKGELMYSWDGTTWDADASVNDSWKTWVDAQDDSVTTSTQFGRDYAFTGKEVVIYSGAHYAPAKSIRYDAWSNDTGQSYAIDDTVSRRQTWASTSAYWKSFKCIKAHDASVITTAAPGTGTDWKVYWSKKRLPVPVESSETSEAWTYVPVAAKTNVAAWHSDRMFMRYDDAGDKSRLLYSAPLKPDKHQDIAAVTWDPTDFAPGGDLRGPGGGWMNFTDGKHQGIITGLKSFGQYLIVFKRRAVWILSGTDDETWTTRRLAEGTGCVGPKAFVEYSDGFVYFLSDRGLYITDGTTVEEAPGNHKVRDFLRTRMDTSLPSLPVNSPVMWQFDGYIWFSIPDTSNSSKYVTMCYDPATSSFWRTNLPVEAAITYRTEGVDKLVFSAPSYYGATFRELLYQYGHASSGDTDDSGADTYAAAAIAWNARLSWWPFGTVPQQRRIRRIWAVVTGSLTYTIKQRVDYNDTAVKTTTRVVGTNERQTLLLSAGAAASTFKLTRGTESVAAVTIPTGGYNFVTAAQIKTCLLTIAAYGGLTADIAVSGENPFFIDFSGTLGVTDIGAITVTSTTGTAAGAVTETRAGGSITVPTYIEGEVPGVDPYALNIEISSTAAPAALLGVAVDTEPRRVKYARY